MAYTKYSLTPANNNATPPDGAPEGMLPSAVNDTMRDMMAQIRDCGDGIRDGTYTMTAPKITGGTITGAAFTGNTFTSPVISGGSINNTPIGGTTANSGAFTTLSASGVATISAGTVSAPALTTTGDTNTGIFFPAADTIAFTEGGVESMRIDSSGNVGIGTSSPSAKLDVDAGNPTVINAGGVTVTGQSSGIRFRTGSTKIAWYVGAQNNIDQAFEITPSTANGGTTFSTPAFVINSSGNVGIGTTSPVNVSNQKSITIDATTVSRIDFRSGGTARFNLQASSTETTFANEGLTPFVYYTNGAERMRIDSSGNVGIGTSAFFYSTAGRGLLELNGSSSALYALKVGNTAYGYFASSSSTTEVAAVGASQPLLFTTNAAERMRITSGGDLLVSKTASDDTTAGLRYVAAQYLSIVRDGNPALYLNRLSSDGRIQEFARSNTIVGNISVTTTATTYNTSSDYRLKENIAPMTGALNIVAQLKPCTYSWKVDGSAGQGFIAHELQAVVPDCVTGEKDAVDDEGKPVYQGVDTSFLVATLTAAIQEQQAMIEELKQEVAALKAK